MTNRTVEWLQSVLFQGDHRGATVAVVVICVAAGIVAGTYVAVMSPFLALVVAGALFVGLMMLRDTQWGFFALVGTACLLPFAAIPIQIGFRPTILDLVLVVLFVVWLAAFASGRRREFVATPLGWPIALFMGLACASFVAGLSHSSATSYVIRHFAEILLAIGLFFIIVNTIRTTRRLQQVISVTIVAGAAQAVIGIFLYVISEEWAIRLLSSLGRLNYPTGAGVLRYIEDDPDLPMRAIGTSVDPNVLGGLMVLMGGLLAPQLFARRPLFRRSFVWGMFALVGLCLYLTYSRAAMLGFLVSLLFVGVLRYRRLLLVLLVAGAIFLVIPQTQEYVGHFVEGIRGQDRATQMRFGEYGDAFVLIMRYPWFGVGFAGTPDIDTYLGVSSAYLLMAQQMGLVGVSVFLIIMATHYYQLLKAWVQVRRDSDLEPLLLGAAAGLSGALVAGILDHYFFNFDFPHSVTLFWLFVGLGATTAYIIRTCSTSETAGESLARGVDRVSEQRASPLQ